MAVFPELPMMKPGPIVGGERTYDLEEVMVMPDGVDIPPGTRTDGASIPKWAQPLVGAHDGPCFAAAIGHDDDYCRNPNKLTRKQADQRFHKLMKLSGVGRVRRNVIYSAVRVGAGRAFSRHKRNRQKTY